MAQKAIILDLLTRGNFPPTQALRHMQNGKPASKVTEADVHSAIERDNFALLDMMVYSHCDKFKGYYMEGSVVMMHMAERRQRALEAEEENPSIENRKYAQKLCSYIRHLIESGVEASISTIKYFVQSNDLPMVRLIIERQGTENICGLHAKTICQMDAPDLELMELILQEVSYPACHIRTVRATDLATVKLAVKYGACYFSDYIRNAIAARNLETLQYLREHSMSNCFMTVDDYELMDIPRRTEFDKEAFYTYVAKELMLDHQLLKLLMEEDGVPELFDRVLLPTVNAPCGW